MPYSKGEKKLMNSLVKQYGAKKANQVYHALLNKCKKNTTEKCKKMFSEKSLKG